MARLVSMFVLSLVVAGSLFYILRWFTARLRKLEVERWGEKAQPKGRRRWTSHAP